MLPLRATLPQLIACVPHVHRRPCALCDAAHSANAPTEEAAGAMMNRPITETLKPLSPQVPQQQRTSVVPAVPSDEIRATVMEQRRRGLRRWMDENLNERGSVDGHNRFASGWALFKDTRTPLTQQVLDEAASYLDSFCGRHYNGSGDTDTGETLSIPRRIRFSNSTASAPMRLQTGGGPRASAENHFLTFVQSQGITAKEETAKQLRFQRALSQLQTIVSTRLGVPFFLACGTALGARREGHFIKHDEDIDIGIFLSDLVSYGCLSAGNDGQAVSLENCATAATVQLMKALTADGEFVVFDICGEVLKGLELRLVHQLTETRVDVNYYYDPIAPDDADLLATRGDFVWTASYYEAASERRHHMYRYLHKPFAAELERLAFCAMGSSEGFRVPPERYLEEYFGPDWRTPKSFTYSEGLSGEYRNIIDE